MTPTLLHASDFDFSHVTPIYTRDFFVIGHADDTISVQTAADMAIAAKRPLVICPRVDGGSGGGAVRLSSTITLKAVDNASWAIPIYFDLGGQNDAVTWAGSNDTAVFRTLGMCYSNIYGARVNIPGSKSNVICWDVDTLATAHSSNLNWIGCHNFMSVKANANIGWRIGHSNTAEMSAIQWMGCSASNGYAGWIIEGSNSTDFKWFGGGPSAMSRGITSVPTAGGVAGGGAWFMFGLGTSNCDIDIEAYRGGNYMWKGGRSEHTGRIFSSPIGTGSNENTILTLGDVMVESADTPDGILFNLRGAVSLRVQSCTIWKTGWANFASQVITASCKSDAVGSIVVEDCMLGSDTLAYTITGGSGPWDIIGRRNKRIGSGTDASKAYLVVGRVPDVTV